MTKAERLALHSTRIARTSFCATCIKSRDPTASQKSTYGSGLSLFFALGFSLSCPRPRTSYLADWPTPAIMLSLVLLILFVHIAIYLINTIGASTVDLLVFLLMISFLNHCFQKMLHVTRVETNHLSSHSYGNST